MNTKSPGATAPTVFKFQETHPLRVIAVDGEPWFVAADVCAALDLGNITNALNRLDDDEATLISIKGRTPTGGEVEQQVNAVNESGLYSLILGSRKPEAKPFKRWVTHEVLPAIRKTGRYVHPGLTFNDPPLANDPFQRIKAPLLSELRRMSKSLAQAYLIECGVTPDYVQQQLAQLGDAIPPAALIYQDEFEKNKIDEFTRSRDEIFEAIKNAGPRGVTTREMKRVKPFTKYTYRQLDDVLLALINGIDIELQTVGRNRNAYVAIVENIGDNMDGNTVDKASGDRWRVACDEIRAAIMSAGQSGVAEQEMNCLPFSRYTKDTLNKILAFLADEEKSINRGSNSSGTRIGYFKSRRPCNEPTRQNQQR
jgi:prophage antirepressor-like protein